MRRLRPVWPVYLLVAMICIAAGFLAVRHARMNQLQHIRIDAAMTDLTRDFPALARARTLAPAFYARLLDAVGGVFVAGGSEQAAVDAGRTVVQQYYREKLPGAPDALLLRILRLTLAESLEVSQVSPQLCVDLLLGRPVGDLSGVLDPATRQDELDTFQAVLQAPGQTEALPAGDERLAQAVAAASQAGAAMLSMPIGDFSAAVRGLGPPSNACAAMMAFLRALTQLPPADQASVFRRLIGGGMAPATSPPVTAAGH